MTVCLKNISRKAFVATLYHDMYCASGGACLCTKRMNRRPVQGASGTVAWRIEEMREPASIRIEPGMLADGLHDAILQIPQVIAATKSKPARLRVVLAASGGAAKKNAPMPPTTDDVGTQTEEPRSSKHTRRGSSKAKG